MTRRKYGNSGGDYEFGNECGCGNKGPSHDNHHKNDDKLDDIIDLLKKLLKKKDNDNPNPNDQCDAITVQFMNEGANRLEIQAFVSSSGNSFGCPLVLDQTNIAELTACLYGKGFKIVAFTALAQLHTYTFVRCS